MPSESLLISTPLGAASSDVDQVADDTPIAMLPEKNPLDDVPLPPGSSTVNGFDRDWGSTDATASLVAFSCTIGGETSALTVDSTRVL